MEYLKRLWKNALASYQLKEEYYKFTSRIGLLVVLLALGLMLYGVFTLASLLGIDTSVPLGKGYSFLALILLPIIYIVSIIPTVLIVVGLTSVYLISKGEITTEQGKKYTLFGEYPSHWFKNTYKKFNKDKKQLAFCSLRSLILANHFLPVNWALCV